MTNKVHVSKDLYQLIEQSFLNYKCVVKKRERARYNKERDKGLALAALPLQKAAACGSRQHTAVSHVCPGQMG